MQDYRVDKSFPDSTHIAIPMDDCKVEQYYSLEDIIGGDSEGTTETDSKTDPKGSGGYSTINSKGGY